MKVAGVVGQSFRGSTLRAVYPVPDDRAFIGAHLEQAEKLELIQRAPGVADAYAFRQAITQDVAYNSVPFAQRRQLHGAIGEWLASANSAQTCRLIRRCRRRWGRLPM